MKWDEWLIIAITVALIIFWHAKSKQIVVGGRTEHLARAVSDVSDARESHTRGVSF